MCAFDWWGYVCHVFCGILDVHFHYTGIHKWVTRLARNVVSQFHVVVFSQGGQIAFCCGIKNQNGVLNCILQWPYGWILTSNFKKWVSTEDVCILLMINDALSSSLELPPWKMKGEGAKSFINIFPPVVFLTDRVCTTAHARLQPNPYSADGIWHNRRTDTSTLELWFRKLTVARSMPLHSRVASSILSIWLWGRADYQVIQ